MKIPTLLLFLTIMFANVDFCRAQTKPYNNDFDRRLHKVMQMAYKTPFGDQLMRDEGVSKNAAHAFGFAIYINSKGFADSVVFTNKTALIDSLVSFKKVGDTIKAEKSLFQSHKNSVIIGFGVVKRFEDRSITDAQAFTNQLWSVYQHLHLDNRRLVISGPFSFFGYRTAHD